MLLSAGDPKMRQSSSPCDTMIDRKLHPHQAIPLQFTLPASQQDEDMFTSLALTQRRIKDVLLTVSMHTD
ncbi:hypothetical protein WAI453_000881 [Rhynchosporium graminicola]